MTGFQLVDADTGAEKQFDGQSEEVKAINAITTDTSIYYLSDGNGGMKWYKDANKSGTLIEYKEAGYVSPEVNGRNVTFRVPTDKAGNAEAVTVPGGMNGWKVDSSDYELKKMKQQVCGLELLLLRQENMNINLQLINHGMFHLQIRRIIE